LKILRFNYFLICTLLIAFSFTAKAHFGYKGISALGKVTCYARNSDSSFFVGTDNGGVFQSTNTNLDGWIARSVGLTSGKISDLVYTGKYLFATTIDKGVFRYTGRDGSDRYWESVSNGLSDFSMTSILAMDSITLFTATSNGKVFYSNDKGVSWKDVTSLLFDGLSIVKIQKAGKRIYVLTEKNGLFMSDNMGQYWVEFNSVNTKQALASNTISYNSSTSEMLLGNSNGLFLLKNASAATNPNFSSVPFTIGTTINHIASNGNAWFVATNKDVYATLNTPISWVQLGLGGVNDTCLKIIPFYSKFVVATKSDGLFQLASAGSQWTWCSSGFNSIVTTSFAIRGENVIAVATEKGVMISGNLGNSYQLKNQGLIDSLSLTDIVFKNSRLFVASSIGGVYVSLDTGSTWTPFVKGLLNLNVVKLFSSKKYVYLIGDQGELYKSDAANSWKPFQNGMGLVSTRSNFTQMNTSVVIASYMKGVFKRNESVDTWQDITGNLPTKKVTAVSFSGTKLFVGTEDLGVFVSDTAQISWKSTAFGLTTKDAQVNLSSTEVSAMAANRGYVFAAVKGAVLATGDDGMTWMDVGTPFNIPSYAQIAKISFSSSKIFINTLTNFLYSNLLAELPAIINITKITYPICGDSINELGKISVQYIGGYEPISIKWNTNDSLSTIKGIKPGKYVVTITDRNGATASDSVFLSFKPCKNPVDTTVVNPVDTTKNTPVDTVKFIVVPDVMYLSQNPVFKELTVSFNLEKQIYRYRLLDRKGARIYSRDDAFIGKSFVIVNNFESGLYVLEVETETGIFRQKIVFLE
jgi:photosystem II stability/assembly factor-like uncharacterized protein